jgi:putative PIN family toxin of toxin-antitoxin system
VRVVVDTNIVVSALLNADGAPREVIRLCLINQLKPLMGAALFTEFRDVLARHELFNKCPLNEIERDELLNAFCGQCEWIPIHFLWRPNLRDEGDNHVIELAIAGGADAVISANLRDLTSGELLFPQLRFRTAGAFLSEWRDTWEQ